MTRDLSNDEYSQFDIGSEELPQPQNPSRIRIRELIFGVGIGVVVTLVATRFVAVSPQSTPNSTPVSLNESQSPAQKVTVAAVSFDSVDQTLKATGTVAPFESIPILSPAVGLQIQQISADEGDFVERGQLLATLDDSVEQAQLQQSRAAVAQYEARLAELRAGNRVEEIAQARATVKQIQSQITQAEADLTLAQKRVERNQSLETDGAITRDRLDELLNDAQVKQAQLQQMRASSQEAQQRLVQLEKGPRSEVIAQAVAQLAEAKAQYQVNAARLKDTKIISPVSGKISKRDARVGDVTKSSQSLFTIIEDGRLELQVKVPETQLTLIRPGQIVTITSDANSSLKIQGRVREIEPIINEESRQGIVAVDLAETNSLKPGMFLSAAIVTNKSQVLTAPMGAVLPQTDGTYLVYKVQPDDKVKASVVQVGEILSDQRIEILAGVQSSDRLVVKGGPYLKDGDSISY
ncbi:efflux RND transporter periplasmic adaptor subunit [Crocosphaera sp. Alani8]|uniref:efflux RND transporter periplasmic adaptor subunit n=1 Tax=Crocosphaera sp. Alani8 TaxID=3038952 RepID=UPI00313DC563